MYPPPPPPPENEYAGVGEMIFEVIDDGVTELDDVPVI